ncbi:MAG: PAS domain-containing protein, partial [Candidatus Binatia bacterium]
MRQKTIQFALGRIASRLWSLLPSGGSLPDEVWRSRHRFLVGLTGLHAVIIISLGLVLEKTWEMSLDALVREDTVLHVAWEGLLVGGFAFLGGRIKASRALRAALVGLGLISSSAILVHLLGGYIELHFHFFVMLTFLALYQDWFPFGLSILYVAVHHGVVGVLWPTEVYNHPAAIESPWTWAGIHAFFVLWASVGSVIAWRLNEAAIARTKLILDSAGEGIFGVDADGKAIFVNPAAEKMLGYPREDLNGRGMYEVLRHARADGTPCPG